LKLSAKQLKDFALKVIESAKADGRKTVMDRDIIIEHLLKPLS
jgi:histone H3/H4